MACVHTFSSLETGDEATEQPGDMIEEEPTPHCLWVDKFAPRRYIELLSDDVSCWGQRGLGGCLLYSLMLWVVGLGLPFHPALGPEPCEVHW